MSGRVSEDSLRDMGNGRSLKAGHTFASECVTCDLLTPLSYQYPPRPLSLRFSTMSDCLSAAVSSEMSSSHVVIGVLKETYVDLAQSAYAGRNFIRAICAL